MTRPLALLVAALIAAVPAAASAQNQGVCPGGTGAAANGSNQEMCFDGDAVRGVVTRSDLDALRRARAMRGVSLIRLRESFVREMHKSVENL